MNIPSTKTNKQLCILAGLLLLSACSSKHPYNDWTIYGGTKENIHYSTLTQIDTANVNKLQVAWTYHTNDADTVNHSQIPCNPVIINGVL
jgi:quinoprotein glucose dehydrogenase